MGLDDISKTKEKYSVRYNTPEPISREHLISIKECCGEGCQMCPYSPKNVAGSTIILDDTN